MRSSSSLLGEGFIMDRIRDARNLNKNLWNLYLKSFSVYSVCSVDFLVAYGKILKDPCRPCDIFRVLLAERTAYESSSVCTHINAAVFLHVSANVEDKTILVVVIVDAHPVVARVVRTEETIDTIYYTYYI